MNKTFDQGFFIAQKLPDGGPGRPIGNDDGAISVFDDLGVATKVRDDMLAEHGLLGIFKINVALAGEVLI